MMPTCHDVTGGLRVMKALYYGDNSVDLIYLDPPFNSKCNSVGSQPERFKLAYGVLPAATRCACANLSLDP